LHLTDARIYSHFRRQDVLVVNIGINEYASNDCPDLRKAVADADLFVEFLQKRLGVVDANIVSLRNREASRNASLSSLQWLETGRIDYTSSVTKIFYFAGHADVRGPVTGTTELLCPGDEGRVQGIEFCRIRDMVRKIVDHGDNIYTHLADGPFNQIVILDCCWSGELLGGSIRGHGRFPRFLKDISSSFQGSYVLLTSSGRDERAIDGLFTRNLLEALDSNLDNLTYISLMHRLKMPEQQTPHCEGSGIQWRLFSHQGPAADESLTLTMRKGDDTFVLQAGSAHGHTIGTRFTAHLTNLKPTPTRPNPAVCILVIKSTDIFSSVLDTARNSDRARLPPLFYLKRVSSKAIRLYIERSHQTWLESVFPVSTQDDLPMMLVNDVQSCDLGLVVSGAQVQFKLHIRLMKTKYKDSGISSTVNGDTVERMTEYILFGLPDTVDVSNVEGIRRVIKAAGHFLHHLAHSSTSTIHRGVKMELHKLAPKLGAGSSSQFLEPSSGNLINEEHAELEVDGEVQFGVTIRNDGPLMLYPYLFYFDPNDLTIQPWYLPPIGVSGTETTRADSPLPPGSPGLAIGYDVAQHTWRFVIPEGRDTDIGFFRLFLSTRPAYFETIQQESPFEVGATRGTSRVLPKAPKAEWSVQTVTIDQKRTYVSKHTEYLSSFLSH
ncbi:hypothetical protein CVT26_014432, partial [Gymnopilus dilepis]